MKRSKVILAAGPAGCRTIERLLEAVDYAKEVEGVDIRLERTFERMREIAETDYNINVTEENILNLLPETLRSLRKDALRKIKERIRKEPGIYIVRSPATFLWGGTLISGIDYDDVDLLHPDVFLVVIDDVMMVKETLKTDPEWKTQRFSLRDLAAWREQEIMTIEDHARRLKSDFFIVARAHSARVFYDLIVHTNRPKVYLSYPMTHVSPEMEEGFREERREFIESLTELGYIVFDPITITEGIILSKLEEYEKEVKRQGKEPDSNDLIEFEVLYDDLGRVKFSYPYLELLNVSELVEGQIVKRDFAMISVSDLVIVYNPLGIGSPGVACEMMYGHRIMGKRVYLIWGGEGRPSPFYTAFCDRRFSTKEEFLEYLKELAESS